MIHQMDTNIWFDAEKLYIITGKDRYHSYLEKQKDYASARLPKEKNRMALDLVFLSSTACNLKCSYCYAGQGTYHGVSETNTLTAENYIKAFELLLKIHSEIKTIGFFGGEPLLGFQEIRRFVEYLHSNYSPANIPYLSISSNGTIMNDEIKEFMYKYEIGFGTSLDGPKCLNDRFRNGRGIPSVYDAVKNTLHLLSDMPSQRRALQFTFSRVHLENYQAGDITRWAKEFESLPILWYEMIAATTEDSYTKIDLNEDKIRRNFEIMCNELADHCLNCLITQETTVMPNIFIATILLVAKRIQSTSCGAGYNITITPDLQVYPCHVIANERSRSVDLSEYYLQAAEANQCFQQIKSLERHNLEECQNCPALNVCGVFCKGMTLENNFKLQPERCLVMKLFLKKVICFMATQYQEHSVRINESIIKISRRHQQR
ncbi:MAG: 4Fe-4S cluster-binding domain-containing protein [Clostridium sp.]|jgi:uncharacterized protein|nr:4Fe-4S cluster-binding domain-containing protein [Clostridium sp.]